MFNKYKEYLMDNPEGFWFKRKLYGWGWTPVKWQGWAVLVAYLVLLLSAVRYFVGQSMYSSKDIPLGLLVIIIVLTAILIFICYKKGESPRWQWGGPKK